MNALASRSVWASVVDVEHYPIQGGVAVGTDYVVEVESVAAAEAETDVSAAREQGGKGKGGGGEFKTFSLSKTYSSFRTLSDELKKSVRDARFSSQKDIWGNKKKRKDLEGLPPGVRSAVDLSESLSKVVHSESYRYLGKINYGHVKAIAKKRKVLINEALNVILTKFPTSDLDHPDVAKLASVVENFFLTDHYGPPPSPPSGGDDDDDDEKNGKKKGKKAADAVADRDPAKNETAAAAGTTKPRDGDRKPDGEGDRASSSSDVVAKTVKPHRSIVIKERDDENLETIGNERGLTLDDEEEGLDVSSSSPSFVDGLREKLDNPATFSAAFLTGLYALRSASHSTITVTIDTDVAMVMMFGLFCLGLHFPRSADVVPASTEAAPPPPVPFEDLAPGGVQRSVHGGASVLIRKSIRASRPPSVKKSVRDLLASASASSSSAPVLKDEEAEEDQHYLASPLPVFPEGAKLGSQFNCWSEPDPKTFKVRGPDYLKNKKKVESGSFIFPIRAVDLFLTDLCPENVGSIDGVLGGKLREKPTFILNFRMPWGVLLFYAEIPSKFLPFLKKRYEPNYDSALPSTDTMTPDDRAVARFLMGDDKHKDETLKIVPVAVKAPWIVKSVVGGKPAIIGTKMPVSYVYQPAEPDKNRAEYLEVDFDIVASAAARQILSVTSSYTNVLTIDLGFLVEGTTDDELPERMLCAARLHGIDAASAPPLPPMNDAFD